jgi:cell division protein FtsZ
MKLKISMPEPTMDLKPRITVVGVGGAGGNAVNNMIRSNLTGVEFLVANTDAQALAMSAADQCIQLGLSLTHGLGAGARPDIGRAAAEEAMEEIMERLSTSHMVFITAGMGGGTGTGAAPVIARAAREAGVLTVGVVTKPFHFEGANRMRAAEDGIEELAKHVDTLIIIPNQNLFRIANERTTFAEAFQMADDVLYSGVRGVTDLMIMPGLINLDFADIRTVMAEMGKAMMGTGESDGEDRAKMAAESAISNPLLDEVSMNGARGVLINITGGDDMTLLEVDSAANRIREEVDSDANIIFGATMDSALEGRIRVSIVATGIDSIAGQQPLPIEPFTTIVGGRPNIGAPALAPAAPAPQVAAVLLEAEETRADEAQAAEAAAQAEAEVVAAAPVVQTEEKPARRIEAEKTAAWTFPSMLSRNNTFASEDAYIPPAPSVPTSSMTTPPPSPTMVTASDVETITPTTAEPQRPRRTFTSLFDRMTGKADEQAETTPGAEATLEPEKGEPSLEAKAPKTDDYLDIPTFLRRQAN